MTGHILLDIALGLYAACELAFILYRRLYDPTDQAMEPPWWLQAVAPFACWLFLPSVLFLCLTPLVQRWTFTLGASLAACLFILHFGLPSWPRRQSLSASRPPGATIRVMAANLFKKNYSCREIADTILALAPDIVVVQELRQRQAIELSAMLREHYPYQDLHPGVDAEGMGAFSRYPLETTALHRLDDESSPVQVLSVQASDQVFWVINMHARIPRLVTRRILGLCLPSGLCSGARRDDVRHISDVVSELPELAILLGDMNTTRECAPYCLIPPEWHNVHETVGHGWSLTYPVEASFFGVRPPFPLFRIDHIFVRGAWQPLAIRAGHMPGSDHRCLIADLRLLPGE